MYKALLVGLVLLLANGNTFAAPGDDPLVRGRMTLSPEWKPVVYLMRMQHFDDLFSGASRLIVDSALVRPDGTFEIPASPGFIRGLYRLNVVPVTQSVNGAIYCGGSTENFNFLYLEPGQVVDMRADISSFSKSIHIESAGVNVRMEQLQHLRSELFSEGDRVRKIVEQSQTLPGGERDSILAAGIATLRRSFEQVNGLLRAYIDTAAHIPFSVVAARYCNYDNDLGRHITYFRSIDSAFMSAAPENPLVSSFHEKLAAYSRMPQVSSLAPEIALADTNGNVIRLSSLRGRVVLVDFWASWCAPCRRENREVLAGIYETYRGRGLEILGVSQDTEADRWTAAIRDDGSAWVQVSDLRGAESEVFKQYEISAIPSNVLLDASGRIAARNLHGSELEQRIRLLLQDHAK